MLLSSHNKVTDKIYKLYSQSTNLSFVDNGFEGKIFTDNETKINTILETVSDNILDIEFPDNEDYQDRDDFDIGETYSYIATSSIEYVNKILFDTDTFLKKCYENPSIFESSDYIVIPLDERFNSKESKYKKNYIALTDLIAFLSKVFFRQTIS